MKILITGSGGFVGKNLVYSLEGKYEIFAPKSSELNLTDYLSVEKYIDQNKITHVVHAAVHSGLSISREEGFQKDLRMLVSLTRNISKLQKLVVFGSGAEFAKTRDMRKVREDQWGEYVPEDLYGLSKFLTNEIVRREPKMINLRLFGIYGPGEDYRYKFISNAIVKNLLGLPITIKQDVVFDYLYIGDLVPVVDHFLSHDHKHSDYNVTTTKSIKISEIVKIINDIADQKSMIEVINSNLNFEYSGSNELLLAEIPALKITGYAEGIKKLYAHYYKLFSEDKLDVNAIRDDDFLIRAKTKSR